MLALKVVYAVLMISVSSALLALELHHRNRPLAARLGGGGLRRQPIRIDRDIKPEIEHPRGGGQAHHAGAQHRNALFL
jgi:hypothetical protein